MRSICRLILGLFVIACGIASAQPAAEQAAAPRKVLIIYSYHDHLPWQAGIRKGLADFLGALPSDARPEIFEERLDAIRLRNTGDQRHFKQYLEAKYKGQSIDAVITETQGAADFLSANADLFQNAPRFLVNITAVVGTGNERVLRIEEDLEEVIRTMLRVMPQTRHIAVSLSRDSSYTLLRKAELARIVGTLSQPVALEFWDALRFEEILARTQALPPESAILYFPTLTDASGARAVPAAFVRKMVETANAPIFVSYDTNLVPGVVGGYVVTARKVGELMGKIALGQALPITDGLIGRSVSSHQFDDGALKRWNIEDELLPPGGGILRRQTSLWSAYRNYLLAGGTALLLQAILIVALLRSRRKLRLTAATLSNEREQLEARIAERTHEVAQAHQRLLMSLRGGRLATWEWDIATNSNRMDDAWLGMLGYVHGEVPETYAGFRSLMHPDDVATMEAAVAANLAGEAEFYEADFRLRAKDGGWRWMHAGGLVVERDAEGRALRMAGIHLDITEQRQAQEAKQAFVSMVSHELRTPINAIIGMSLRVLRTELNPQQRDYIDKIAKSSEILLRIINDILDYAKLEAGKLELAHSPFLLGDILSRVVDIVGVATEARGLQLRVDVAPDVPPALLGDGLRLEQILINLASNAAKFTETGEVIVGVKSGRLEATAVELIFSVRDTGIGIAAKDLAELFKPFSQLDGSLARRHGGTGLGLSISQQLVDMMGGHIWAESTPGQGSNFQFVVYLDIDPHAAVATDLAANHAATPPEVLRGKRILLVEDNAFNAQVAREMLEDAGILVVLAANGREAVTKAALAEYDAILMDIQMPVMDGLEATRRIRVNSALTRLPIIAMTAHGMPEMRQQGVEAGVSDYLIKPIMPGMLYATLAHWLAPESSPAHESSAHRREAALPEALPGIDMEVALKMVAGQSGRLASRLKHFVAEMGDAGERLQRMASEWNWTETRQLAHALKGASGTLGAMKLQELADALLKESDIQLRLARIGEIKGELEKIAAAASRLALEQPAIANATPPENAEAARQAWATLAERIARNLHIPDDMLDSLEAGLGDPAQRAGMENLRAALARFDYSGAGKIMATLATDKDRS